MHLTLLVSSVLCCAVHLAPANRWLCMCELFFLFGICFHYSISISKISIFCYFHQKFNSKRYKLMIQNRKLPYLTRAMVIARSIGVYGVLNAIWFNWLGFISMSSSNNSNKQTCRYCSNFPCHQTLCVINGSMPVSMFVCVLCTTIQNDGWWTLNTTKLIRIAK